MEFNISTPFSKNPVHCLGEVCRVDGAKARGSKIAVFGIAVRFTKIEQEAKEAINKFAKTYIK